MTRYSLWAVVLFSVLVASAPAQAEKTIWIDENGIVHSEVKNVPGAEIRRTQVELFVTDWCPYCAKAKQFFRSRNIPYTAYDIEKDRSAALRKNQLDNRNGIPFAVINGQKVHGFSPEAYEKALKVRR